MVAVPSSPPFVDDDDLEEQRLLLHGISWDQYSQLLAVFEDRSGLRITYLDGQVELMSPSRAHERIKKLVALLVEAYAQEHDLNLNGEGSTTFRKEAVQRGAEPDECYTLGAEKPVPDLAIEIVRSRPKLDKLEVYRGLGVGEVWIHHKGVLSVNLLVDGRYVERSSSSALLPALDLELLLRFVRPDEDQTPLVKAYRAALASRR